LLLAQRFHVLSDGSFALRVTRTVIKLERMQEAESGHFRFAEVVPGYTHFVEHVGLRFTIIEELEFGECVLENADRLHGIVDKIDVGRPEISQREGFAAAILQFAEDGECLIEAFDALLLVTEREIGKAHVVECGAASSFVTRRIDDEGVTVVAVGLLRESPTTVDISDMRDGCGFVLGISDLMPDCAGCLELLDSFLLLVKSVAGNRDRTQNVRLGFSVAGLACLRKQGLKGRERVLKWSCIGDCGPYRRGRVCHRLLGPQGRHCDEGSCEG
jgi:hypothetical protein